MDENAAEGRVNGKVDFSYTIHAKNTSAPSSDPPQNLPQGYQLYQNYPNPFNSFTIISFQLAQVSLVSIKIYDVHGREVRTLVNKMIEPGFHTVGWDGLNNFGNIVSSGLFLCRMKAEKFEKTIKLIMLN